MWWLRVYRPPEEHPRLGAAELAYIRSDPAEAVTPIKWSRLIPHRQTWAFAVGKFMTDPIWWLYLFWIPDFLNRNHGLDLKSIGLPLVVIYLVADVGSIGAGGSPRPIKAVERQRRARRPCGCALAVVQSSSPRAREPGRRDPGGHRAADNGGRQPLTLNRTCSATRAGVVVGLGACRGGGGLLIASPSARSCSEGQLVTIF